MIIVDINKLPEPYCDVIDIFWVENNELSDDEYIEKFQKTFRCKAVRNEQQKWDLIFKEEDYTWFLLVWC